jgi:hypothetical protein
VGKNAGSCVDHPNQCGNGNHYATIKVVTTEALRLETRGLGIEIMGTKKEVN